MAGMDDWGKENTVSRTEEEQALQKVNSTTPAHFSIDRRGEVKVMDSMHVKSPEPTQDSATEENLSSLARNVDEAFSCLADLESRISDILKDSEPSQSLNEKGYRRNTRMSDRLATLASKMDDLNNRLRALYSLIDL